MSTPRCTVCAVKVKKGYQQCYRCQVAINTYCTTDRDASYSEGIAYFANQPLPERLTLLQEWAERGGYLPTYYPNR